jgi:N4-gp56 family major capsid protein
MRNASKSLPGLLLGLLDKFLPDGWLTHGLTNTAGQFQADIVGYIQDEVLDLSYRFLVAYQFGDPLRLPENRGTTYTASRYVRLPLPFAPLQEGIAPPGEQMTLQQVTVTAQQWGDSVTITDVAQLTIYHNLFKLGTELVSLQVNETLERNTFNSLLAGTNVNYANGKTSRANLVAGDTLNNHDVNRSFAVMDNYGVPRFSGGELKDIFKDVQMYRPVKDMPASQHYVAVVGAIPVQDLRENALVNNAWVYNDTAKLYNNEIGDWGGFRWTTSNMIPYWTGVAQINPVASAAGGNLATGNYFVVVTAAPALTSVEQSIYQVSASTAVVGPTGSLSVALPAKAGYVFNVYVGTTSAPANLGLAAAGPGVGALAGQATQLQGNQTVIITGLGVAQTPPAAPATGVTVWPTFLIGKHAYGQVVLSDPEFFYLTGADKSDRLNQTKVIGWKVFYGTILLNQNFFLRLESASSFSPNPDSGAFSIVN